MRLLVVRIMLSLHSFSEVPATHPALQGADVDRVLAAVDARLDACWKRRARSKTCCQWV